MIASDGTISEGVLRGIAGLGQVRELPRTNGICVSRFQIVEAERTEGRAGNTRTSAVHELAPR